MFYLYVLDDVFAYQVTEINTVLPSDTSLLGIWEGEDCCTLVTCTPYGINTHRLLVTASRIPYYYWGHYLTSREDAERDLVKRASERIRFLDSIRREKQPEKKKERER